MENPRFNVSQFIAVTNQTLDYAMPLVEVEGEVASFKVNQGKYVFFDLKDEEASINCFLMVFQLRQPIEDGMKVIVAAQPKLTKWGKFSLTVKSIRPTGEGSLKKSFELLKAKLDKEGLFAAERKRPLPEVPQHVAVISSTDSAGYADFVKIINNRWGGLKVEAAHVQVQGESAPDQIIRAIDYFNAQPDLAEALVLIRGGGSADDLATFNDEKLVRSLAASRIPTLVGVGHEVDVSLSDLVADQRAATPSNAAEILVPSRADVIRLVEGQVFGMSQRFKRAVSDEQRGIIERIDRAFARLELGLVSQVDKLKALEAWLRQLNPDTVLRRGYSIVHGQVQPGQMIQIETINNLIEAEVTNVKKR